MREKIDVFLPAIAADTLAETVQVLNDDKTVQHIVFLQPGSNAIENALASTETILHIADNTDADFVLLCTKTTHMTLGQNASTAIITQSQAGGRSVIRPSIISREASAMTSTSAACYSCAHRCCTTMPRRHALRRAAIALQPSTIFGST